MVYVCYRIINKQDYIIIFNGNKRETNDNIYAKKKITEEDPGKRLSSMEVFEL